MRGRQTRVGRKECRWCAGGEKREGGGEAMRKVSAASSSSWALLLSLLHLSLSLSPLHGSVVTPRPPLKSRPSTVGHAAAPDRGSRLGILKLEEEIGQVRLRHDSLRRQGSTGSSDRGSGWRQGGLPHTGRLMSIHSRDSRQLGTTLRTRLSPWRSAAGTNHLGVWPTHRPAFGAGMCIVRLFCRLDTGRKGGMDAR